MKVLLALFTSSMAKHQRNPVTWLLRFYLFIWFFSPPWHIVNSMLAACFTWETGSWQTEASRNTSCFSLFQGSPSAGKHPYQHVFKERAGLGPYKNWSTHLSSTTEKFHRKSQNKSWAIFERFGLKSRKDRQHLKCKVCNNWNLLTISQKKR